MDFLQFLGVAFGITTAFAVPVAALMYLKSKLRPPIPSGTEEEIEALRARVAELEGLQQRLMEVEERVDFAERLLARPKS